MIIALSSFAPFGGRKTNNSSRLLEELKSVHVDDPHLKLQFLKPLPVVYDTCFEELKKQLQTLPCMPDVLLAFGEASTEKLKLETLAKNLRNSDKSDEAGMIYAGKIIDEEGPSTIENSIGFAKLFHQLASSVQVRFELSIDCGQFVCNTLNYEALLRLPATIKFGFIHVSNSKEDLSQDAQAVFELIRII